MMSGTLYDLVRVTTPSTGVVTTIALGPAVPPFLSFAGGGVPDGDTVSIAISDTGGSPAQGLTGRGVYSAGANTVTITSISASSNAGAMISLSGSAQIAISPIALDFEPVSGSVPYNATLQALIGGYPAGALVESAVTTGLFWISAVANNLTNPDTGGAGWLLAKLGNSGVVTMQLSGLAGQPNTSWIVVKPDGSILSTTGSQSDGLQEAINYAIDNGYALDIIGQGSQVISQQNGVLNGTNVVTGLSSTAALFTGCYVTGTGIPAFTTVASIDSSSQIHISNAAATNGTNALTFASLRAAINCAAPITVGPTEQWSWKARNVNFTFASSVAGAGLVFDSMIITDVDLRGCQIVYQGNNAAVSFAPKNSVFEDGFPAITASTIFISNIACPAAIGTNNAVVNFNCSLGGINNNTIGFVEINGAGSGTSPLTGVGIEVLGPTASTGFEQNIIDIAQIHLFSSAGVQVGTNTVNANVLRQNTWRIGGIEPAGATAAGFDTYGNGDIITIGGITTEEGTFENAVVFQSSAGGNNITVGQVVGNTGAALVESVPGSNIINGSNLRVPSYGANKGYYWNPDGTLTQYINNAAGNTSGATSTFAIEFPTELLSCVVSSENVTSGFQASGNQTGVTITTASSSGTFSVIGVGR